MAGEHDITMLLHAWGSGDAVAGEQLGALVYQELREMARQRLAGERGDHTLQPTALVNEAYLRLVQGGVSLNDRIHFFATAALHMRSILVDHARARLAGKRGGDQVRVTLAEDLQAPDSGDAELLALDVALTALQEADERTARVVELTYFGGLQRDEVAQALSISVPTVDRALRFGRAWLKQALDG